MRTFVGPSAGAPWRGRVMYPRRSRSRASRRRTATVQSRSPVNRSLRSGEAESSAKTIEVAAVTRKTPAGNRKAGDEAKINAPEIISAEMMNPLSEIMMFAFIAASAIVSSSAR